MKKTTMVCALALATAASFAGSVRAQQNPVARQQPQGLGVSPVFEGWYQNPDGTFTLSFGFQNRNTAQVLSIPVGPSNKVEPARSTRASRPTSSLAVATGCSQ